MSISIVQGRAGKGIAVDLYVSLSISSMTRNRSSSSLGSMYALIMLLCNCNLFFVVCRLLPYGS